MPEFYHDKIKNFLNDTDITCETDASQIYSKNINEEMKIIFYNERNVPIETIKNINKKI